MDLEPFLTHVRRDLSAAARAAGVDEAVDRALDLLEPSLRLAVLELLSQAAEEVSAALPGAEVALRLRGRDPGFVVEPPTPTPTPNHAAALDEELEHDDPLVRVSLRIPESVKARAEEEATRGGLSLNAWMVGALRAATWRRAAMPGFDLTSIPLEAPLRLPHGSAHASRTGDTSTGITWSPPPSSPG